MTAKELMQPRFEVIETYPKSKFKKGDILERIPNATNDWYNADKSLINADILLEEIEQYPHLFRKMNWWEKRTVEQMPKRLMSILDDMCDGHQRYEEKEEEIIISRRPKKTEKRLIGRIYWKEEFKDEDTGKGIWIERSQVVRVNGEWR